MPTPTTPLLLDTWERVRGNPLLDRGLALLAFMRPDLPRDEISRWSIGRRDAELLALRASAFGRFMHCTTRCPACGQSLEFTCTTEDLRTETAADCADSLTIKTGAWEVQCHVPASEDLEAVATDPRGAGALLQRCVAVALHEGEPVATDALPPELNAEIERRLQEADPQADVMVALSCPTCSHQWEDSFDILAFLWEEVDAWAWRTLGEVHALARAHGWSEAEILSMSATRRRLYLEVIES